MYLSFWNFQVHSPTLCSFDIESAVEQQSKKKFVAYMQRNLKMSLKSYDIREWAIAN
jgi:hypothetical protein